jgi:hypothetical protein
LKTLPFCKDERCKIALSAGQEKGKEEIESYVDDHHG